MDSTYIIIIVVALLIAAIAIYYFFFSQTKESIALDYLKKLAKIDKSGRVMLNLEFVKNYPKIKDNIQETYKKIDELMKKDKLEEASKFLATQM